MNPIVRACHHFPNPQRATINSNPEDGGRPESDDPHERLRGDRVRGIHKGLFEPGYISFTNRLR